MSFYFMMGQNFPDFGAASGCPIPVGCKGFPYAHDIILSTTGQIVECPLQLGQPQAATEFKKDAI
jgi:hypothetical protein